MAESLRVRIGRDGSVVVAIVDDLERVCCLAGTIWEGRL
jgi:hypothetical protein